MESKWACRILSLFINPTNVYLFSSYSIVGAIFDPLRDSVTGT